MELPQFLCKNGKKTTVLEYLKKSYKMFKIFFPFSFSIENEKNKMNPLFARF